MQDNDREMPKIDETLLFVVNEKNNYIELTDKGIDVLSLSLMTIRDKFKKLSKEEEKNQKRRNIKILYVKSARIHIMNQLLKAYILFEKDVDLIEGQDSR